MAQSKALIVQRIVGALFLLAGLVKPLPAVENVPQLLRDAAQANEGTWMEGASRQLAEHSGLVVAFVALTMIASGICLLWNKYLVRSAAVGQIVMLCCFMAVLHRLAPIVVVVDLAFIAADVWIIYAHASPAGTGH
jgi:hypothetical protein